jgi:hypothetical protein
MIVLRVVPIEMLLVLLSEMGTYGFKNLMRVDFGGVAQLARAYGSYP